MSLFQPKYKSKGKSVKAKKWWINFRGPSGTVHRWSLDTESKDIAEIMESQLNSLTMWASKKMEPPKELVKWVQRQEPGFRQKIYDVGLLPAGKVSETRTIQELLEDYKKSLLMNTTEYYRQQITGRIESIIKGCGFEFWHDVSNEKISAEVIRLTESGMSRHTGDMYIAAFRRFARWLKKQRKIIELPEIDSMKFEATIHRALEGDEYLRLLETVKTEKPRRGLTGYQRYVLYRLAVESGLRLRELEQLTAGSFNFNFRKVIVRAGKTKSRKMAKLSMGHELTALIQDYTKNMLPETKLFHLTKAAPEILRKDCEAAGVPTETVEGKICFHSLRHTCASLLISAGVSIKAVQKHMRHADPQITLRIYAHFMKDDDEKITSVFESIEKQEKQCNQKVG